jgi:ABC-2 type transport system ATP-binding protein
MIILLCRATMIRLSNIVQHYGVRPVLRGINIDIQRSEVVAVMGPNGMGKSTLLAVMGGILSPQQGIVEIDGKQRRRTPEEELAIRRLVVYLPDSPWVPQQRTGREWLLAVGRLYEVPDDRLMDHIDRLLDLFCLTQNGDSAISSYSTGQRKKIALCSALVTEAPVMILDEPFSGGLDPSGLLVMKNILQHLSKNTERTIVLATPVPELVEEVADRILLLRDGRIVAFDTPDGLRRTAGCSGPLQEVYEQMTNPQSIENMQRYFREFPR